MQIERRVTTRAAMLLLSFSISLCIASYAESRQAADNWGIYQHGIPPGLTQKLNAQMEDHKKKLAVAKKDAADVRTAIRRVRLISQILTRY